MVAALQFIFTSLPLLQLNPVRCAAAASRRQKLDTNVHTHTHTFISALELHTHVHTYMHTYMLYVPAFHHLGAALCVLSSMLDGLNNACVVSIAYVIPLHSICCVFTISLAQLRYFLCLLRTSCVASRPAARI